MKEKSIKRYRHSTALSRGQKLLIAFVAAVVMVLEITAMAFYYRSQKEKEINAAKIYGENVATGISLSINQCINSTQVLKDLYIEYGEQFVRDFNAICEKFIDDNVVIGSLYIAPDGIISRAHPKSVEPSTLGFEMFKDPQQAEKALLAVSSGKITLAGPHRLVEGGNGLIIRNPIFSDGKFNAFIIAVLNWDEFVKQVLNHISKKVTGYRFGVWKQGDLNVFTDEFGFIFKNCENDVSKLVDMEIEVPNDVWHLSVEPENGWRFIWSIKEEIISSFLFGILIIFGVFMRQRENAKKIYYINHDELTGLLQRPAFLKRVEQILKEHPDKKFNVIASDIKNFKVVNGIYGNQTGNEVLKYLAGKYLELNPHGICSRYGGDQFICLVEMSDVEKDYEQIEVRAIKITDGAPVPNLNIKYGFYGNIDRKLPATLICDRALLAARSILNDYNSIVSNYDGAISKSNLRKQMLESSFLTALENKNFKIWYQPKFDSFTEELIGSEALVRWVRTDGNIVSPADFIPVFEEDGLIYNLDLYVFREVCEKIKLWRETGKTVLPVSINVSRMTLQRSGVAQQYKKIVEEYGVSFDDVPLEITESATSNARKIQELTEEFRNLGFKIHMDDFGSGFSSLGNLNLMNFDEIKLDKSLIDFIGTPGGDELLRHTVELAQFKGIMTIAEGVETKTQLEFLKKLKCNHIQGYYFSAPLPYEQFLEFLMKHKK